MPEEFVTSSLVLPGTYVRVRADGLIGVGGISTGNIAVVGTAAQGTGETHLVSSPAEALELFGASDGIDTRTLNLTRIIRTLFSAGARTIYARAVAAAPDNADFTSAFDELAKEDVQILLAPELDTADAITILGARVDADEGEANNMIAVIGSGDTAEADIDINNVPDNDRIILCAPGYRQKGANDAGNEVTVDMPGTYMAAAVAGLLASLPPQSSPTNKVIPGIGSLTERYSYGERVALVNKRVLVLEQRGGARVVRGLSTDTGGFTQITTRRIVDFAKDGIRKVGNPFIGRLNNTRVRAALQGAIDGFLTTMLQDEQLTNYSLEVTATRQDEINGRAIVNVVLQPTFSIDFIAVTLTLG